MTAPGYTSSSDKKRIPWRDVFEAVQWIAAGLFIALFACAAINFFGSFTSYSGIGARFAQIAAAPVDWISRVVLQAEDTAAGKRQAGYLIMALTLFLSAASTVRDKRVGLVSAVFLVASITVVWLHHSQALSPAISELAFLAIALFSLVTIGLIYVSLYRTPIRKRSKRSSETWRIKAVFIYWSAVAVLCIFQISSSTSNPLAEDGAAEGTIVLIFITAAVLFASVYFFPSFLAFLQIAFWFGIMSATQFSGVNLAEIITNPVPAIFDQAIYPAGNGVAAMLVLMAWLHLAICSLIGALNNKRFVALHIIAILGALLITVLSADTASLGSGLLGLFELSTAA